MDDLGSATTPPAESGYAAWLRYGTWPAGALHLPESSALHRVAAAGSSELAATARTELVAGIGALTGRLPDVVAQVPPSLPCLRLGTVADPDLAALVAAADLEPPPQDGFVLFGRAAPAQVAVVGGDDRGSLYGVFGLLRRLFLGEGLPSDPVAEAPAIELRILEHWDNLDGSVERGYAGRSIFFADGGPVSEQRRLADYARLLASVGVNAVAVNNVNTGREAAALLEPEGLLGLAEAARTLRRHGVRVFISVSFAAPVLSGALPTWDPRDVAVRRWWEATALRVYSHIPDLVGFVVKADSESRPGPHTYGRDHAEGANVLAAALAPFG